jgi:aminoglycoside 3-N-acetyltransferase
LVMPTHTDGRGDNGRVFDVRRSPSRTGILSELLRRRPGARRSLHPLYSVCAKGPLAERLVADHHREPPKAFGLYSPYAKLAELDAQVLGIGLPPGHTTLLHVVEDVRPEKFPRLYSGQTAEFVAVDEAGRRFALSARRFVPRMLAKRDVMRVVRHLSEEAMRSITLCGVVAFVASAGRLLDEHFALTDQGITMYG